MKGSNYNWEWNAAVLTFLNESVLLLLYNIKQTDREPEQKFYITFSHRQWTLVWPLDFYIKSHQNLVCFSVFKGW